MGGSETGTGRLSNGNTDHKCRWQKEGVKAMVGWEVVMVNLEVMVLVIWVSDRGSDDRVM